jgi:hypothetical protein
LYVSVFFHSRSLNRLHLLPHLFLQMVVLLNLSILVILPQDTLHHLYYSIVKSNACSYSSSLSVISKTTATKNL